MLVCVNEIHSFLASVLTGGTVKVSVGTRIVLVDETNEVILHGSFMFHVEIKLAVHDFELGT